MVLDVRVAEQSPRVVLHVGLPKTGTTFLQRMLAGHREQLRERGFLYPDLGPSGMFRSAVDLRRLNDHWGLDPALTDGLWQELCRQARSFPGTTIMGHEILSGAPEDTVERVTHDLGDLDVEVVVTARDLGRQIPAWWQESVKNDSDRTFEQALREQVLGPLEAGHRNTWFWRSQDLAAVVDRWSAVAPGERLHVVTNRPDAPSEELWCRFAAAAGLPTTGLEIPEQPSNRSLGVAEVALLRATNEALAGRIERPHSSRLVKRYFAQGVLSAHTSRAARTPHWARRELAEVTREWVRRINRGGHRVHGSLDELEPVVAAQDEPPPDEVAPAQIAALAPKVTAELLVEMRRLRHEVAAQRRRLRAADAELEQLRATPHALRVRARRLAGRLRRAVARVVDGSRGR